MSDDIVARLRQTHRVGCDCVGCEAADEIERLRSVVEAWLKYSQRAEREIERLRAERDEVRQSYCSLMEAYRGGDGRVTANKLGWGYLFEENRREVERLTTERDEARREVCELLCNPPADEIERLRKELAETRTQSAEDSSFADDMGEQMSRLRQRVIRAEAEAQFLRGQVRRLEETIAIGIGGDTMQGEMPSDAELAEMLTELAESYDSICEGEKANLIRQAATRIRDQRGTINTLRAEVIVLTEKVERRGVGS